MKDFDFDELDRAVNSVLATKDTKTDATADPATTDGSQQPVQTTDQPNDNVPVTVQAQPEEPDSHEEKPQVTSEQNDQNKVSVEAHEESADTTDVVVNTRSHGTDEAYVDRVQELQDMARDGNTDTASSDNQNDESTEEPKVSPEPSEPSEVNDDHAASLAAIPVKRGRFMDMVAPGTGTNDTAKKPLPAHSTVTLTPSSEFVATTTVKSDDEHTTAQDTSQTDLTVPVVDSEIEPEVHALADDEKTLDTDLDNAQDAEAEKDDVALLEPSTDDDAVSTNTVAPAGDSAPFIPDVPVEKRPLNALSGDAAESADSPVAESDGEPTAAVVDPTLFANAPKEFDKDIMAVEANETVGEHDESQPAADKSTDTSAPAMTATGAEPHPMFDTSTLAHAGGAAAHHTSKMSWAVVGVSLFIVGAALGVLYFLYG